MANPLSLMQSTPIKPKVAIFRVGQSIPELKELRKDIDHDMRGSWIGFVSPLNFILKLMDKANTSPPPADIPSVEGLPEHKMYEPFLQGVLKLCPNLPIYLTANARRNQAQLRPDGGVSEQPARSTCGSEILQAPRHDATSIVHATDGGEARASGEGDGETLKHLPFDWHTHGLIVEFKSASKDDPFYSYDEAKKVKPQPMIEKTDDDSSKTLAQLAHYAAELFNHQHRTHAFQILVCGDTIRFLYWDRAGAVVSDKFNFREKRTLLPRFLWCYQHMSASRRGWDETVTEPSPEDVTVFRTNVERLLADMEDPKSGQRYIANAEHTLDKDYPPYKMKVEAGMIGCSQELILQRPVEVTHSPTGRGTRGYIAYSITEKKIVFLKDSWRVKTAGLAREDNIYSALKKANVEGLPDVLCAGDVRVGNSNEYQKTWVQKIARQTEGLPLKIPSSETRTHMHHRVVQELAYSLSTSANTKEYTVAFRDAFKTIDQAYKAGILHRDISFNNIMLNAKGKVVVNDWDHAWFFEMPRTKPVKSFRTGTWPFMSISLLRDTLKTHNLLDDFESLFWSKLFGALKFADGDIKLGLKAFYEHEWEESSDGPQMVGGVAKRGLLDLGLTRLPFASDSLSKLFKHLSKIWCTYYRALDDHIKDPEDEELSTNFQAQDKKMRAPSFWYNEIDRFVNMLDWVACDMKKDRFPPEPEKKIKVKVRERCFSVAMKTEARSRTEGVPRNDSSDDDGEGTEGVDEHRAVLPKAVTGVAPSGAADASLSRNHPGPSSDAIAGHHGSEGRGSSRAHPLNLNGKRTRSIRGDDNDSDDESASKPLALPRSTKRPKRVNRAGTASSKVKPRTRTRSAPSVPSGEPRRSSRLIEKRMGPGI